MQDNDLLIGLSQPSPICQSHSVELLMQVVWYIKDHLNADLSAAALARAFSVEECVLIPAFESHIGITLDQFVLRRRIERALDLLKNSNATECDIAARIGLGTARSFQAIFFDYLRISPADYRKSLPRKSLPASLKTRKRPCKRAYLPEQFLGRVPRAVAR